MRGAFLAKGPDSSAGGVPVGYCPDDVHVEEEVQHKFRVEEEEWIGEIHREEQSEEQRERKNNQVAHMGDHADDMTRTNTFLNHAV